MPQPDYRRPTAEDAVLSREIVLIRAKRRFMYSEQVLEHFQNPRNVGDLENPTASAQVENPACGDIMRLSVRVDGERIVAVAFRAQGCVPSIACGSQLTEALQGRTLAEAHALKREHLVQELGGLPEASTHAGTLAMDALKAVLVKVQAG
ncbi:MAG: iron-sulfur cluster assembly scaffold protein [Candidatus Korobacteraceae bacterium]